MASLPKEGHQSDEAKASFWTVHYFGKEINRYFKTVGRSRKNWSQHVTDADLMRWETVLKSYPWITNQTFASRTEAKQTLQKIVTTWEEMASQLVADIHLRTQEITPEHYQLRWYNPTDGFSNEAEISVEPSN
ncbi:hypothetical protein JN01_0664 [Entomoplasma freundtii]|uniref:Uncharacterized protein n=1 Tax=Entomoplasma freundtii TaxID=74700 RepID=A0A2K8NTE3_9MOLU|nr:hypothetical protein [Entomoplasma freundtii]ATZ16448.1 hypothetical protein EFREU_v1c04220 [Entomoplasma freundtii]TDY55978.1 hypothetical protein JN01_0664 [Entomoplasma freundtii]